MNYYEQLYVHNLITFNIKSKSIVVLKADIEEYLVNVK